MTLQFNTKYNRKKRVYILSIENEDTENCGLCGQSLPGSTSPSIILGTIAEISIHLDSSSRSPVISYMITRNTGTEDWYHRFENEVYSTLKQAEKALTQRNKKTNT